MLSNVIFFRNSDEKQYIFSLPAHKLESSVFDRPTSIGKLDNYMNKEYQYRLSNYDNIHEDSFGSTLKC